LRGQIEGMERGNNGNVGKNDGRVGRDKGDKKQGKCVKEEIEGLRRDIGEKEKRWREEREGLRESIRGLEERMKTMEERKKEGQMEKVVEGRNEEKVVIERVKEIEKRLERKERQERRRNVIIKGMEVKEGKRREAVEEVFERIGARVRIEEVKKLGKGEGLAEIVCVKLESEEQKREVMGRKSKLRGMKERVMEDWTWKERRMRWKLEEIARKEMAKGRKVWLGYGMIKIDESWWRWDEEEEVLLEGRGMVRGESSEEDKGL